MNRLPYQVEPAMPGKEHLGAKTLALSIFGDGGKQETVQRKYLIPEFVAAEKMKGVGKDYKIYRIFGSECLGDYVFAPPPSVETLMAPTRSFLAEHGFYALDLNDLLP